MGLAPVDLLDYVDWFCPFCTLAPYNEPYNEGCPSGQRARTFRLLFKLLAVSAVSVTSGARGRGQFNLSLV